MNITELWQSCARDGERLFDVRQCRRFLTLLGKQAPSLLAWAEDAAQCTTFRCRRYGGRHGPVQWYCWAESDVVDPATGREFHQDPWPASRYPKDAVTAGLALGKHDNPALAIACAVRFDAIKEMSHAERQDAA